MRRNSFNGINVSGHDIYELRYADDIALLSDTKEGSSAPCQSMVKRMF